MINISIERDLSEELSLQLKVDNKTSSLGFISNGKKIFGVLFDRKDIYKLLKALQSSIVMDEDYIFDSALSMFVWTDSNDQRFEITSKQSLDLNKKAILIKVFNKDLQHIIELPMSEVVEMIATLKAFNSLLEQLESSTVSYVAQFDKNNLVDLVKKGGIDDDVLIELYSEGLIDEFDIEELSEDGYIAEELANAILENE